MVPNIKLVRDICRELNLDFDILGDNDNLIVVNQAGKKCFFAYTTTPFNTEDVQHVCSDKSLTQEIVSSKVRMPKTKKYLRPDLDLSWHDKIEFSSESDIVADIQNKFGFPCMVKMNAGSLGINVFRCDGVEDITKAAKKIFKEDWALLAQELVDKEREFRVVIVNNSVELIYYKGASKFFARGTGTFKEVNEFLSPLKVCINLGWAGLDVIKDREGKLWLIEINTRPSFSASVRVGKQKEIEVLYKKALKEICGIEGEKSASKIIAGTARSMGVEVK